MKKVFLDVNVMIDIMGQREPFSVPALQLMALADRGIVQIYVSAMSYATASFILGRYNKEVDVLNEFSKFMQITTATPVDAVTLDSSIHSGFTDFEDAMQYFSAQRENVDFIVTRNKKDFAAATIPVFEPQEFIDWLIG